MTSLETLKRLYRSLIQWLRFPLLCCRQLDMQPLAQVDGGVVDRQAVGGGPEVQGVSSAAALEAVKNVGVGVDAEAAGGAAGRTMQGAGAALLAGVVGAWGEAKQRQHLGDGNGGPNGVEVDGGA